MPRRPRRPGGAMTLWADPDVSGWADDALDDVETFCKVERKRWAH